MYPTFRVAVFSTRFLARLMQEVAFCRCQYSSIGGTEAIDHSGDQLVQMENRPVVLPRGLEVLSETRLERRTLSCREHSSALTGAYWKLRN